MLNLFNGDVLFENWKKARLPGEALVWRENYLEGPLPDTDSAEEWCAVRAKNPAVSVPEFSGESIFRYLLLMERTLEQLDGRGEVVLWFDECIYDFTLLLRIFRKISRSPGSAKCRLSLICTDRLSGADAEGLVREFSSRRTLTRGVLLEGASLWSARLSGRSAFERQIPRCSGLWHPDFNETAHRLAEDLGEGMSLTKRRLFAILRGGEREPSGVFRKFSAGERHPFLGDTQCWRLLDEMAEAGLISIKADGIPVKLYGRAGGVSGVEVAPAFLASKLLAT